VAYGVRYHPCVPLIRCAKCGQAYDVPGVIAVRLPNSIATCDCGEWLSGSKAALLARLMNPEDIKEIDMKPYKVDRGGDTPPPSSAVDPHEAQTLGQPRSIHVIARGARESVQSLRSACIRSGSAGRDATSSCRKRSCRFAIVRFFSGEAT
jgi:hypothetical protein